MSDDLLSQLQALNPSQFETVCHRFGAPAYFLRTETQTAAAVDLLRYAGKNRTDELAAWVREVRMPFDVHILHCDADRAWAENLARNLADHGVSVAPMDPRNLRPVVWQQARRVILVAGARSIAEGWASEQYQRLAAYGGPGFAFLPVVREAVETPFPGIACIDFSADYGQGFACLWQTWFDTPPPPSETLEFPRKGEASDPSATLPAFVDEVFAHFHQASPAPLMVLMQKGWNQPWIVDTLLARAQALYPRRAWHMAAPHTGDAALFFHQLARQCGLEADSQISLESGLKQRLDDHLPHFF